MNKRIRGFAGAIGAIVLCSALPLLGQTSVVVHLTDFTGDPVISGLNGGPDVYGGVYNGYTVPAVASPGLVCDDFNGVVSPGSSWNAIAYNVSTIGTTTPVTNLLFGGNALVSPPLPNIGLGGYAELAYLVNLMFNTSDTEAQGDISQAIWKITDPTLTGIDADAQSYLSAALGHAGDSLGQYTNLWIYVPDPLGGSLGTTQEMWGRVPEGGSALLYLLLGGLFCFGAMFVGTRDRLGALKA